MVYIPVAQPFCPKAAPMRPLKLQMAKSRHPRISKLLVPFSRFAIRFHVSLILIGTLASGWVFTKLLLMIGIGYMPVRYFISTLCAYGIFILLSSLWLKYLGRYSKVSLPRTRQTHSDYIDAPLEAPDLAGQPSVNLPEQWSGGGGGFSGAGASGSFAEGVSEWPSDSSGPSLPDLPDASLDIDDIFGAILAFILVTVVLFLLMWSGYLLIQLPLLVVEGLFHGILTTALIRATKRIDDYNRAESVFKNTRWIAAGILVITLACGFAAEFKCPAAQKLSDVLYCKAKQETIMNGPHENIEMTCVRSLLALA